MANMVIYINDDNTVGEYFPEINPAFPEFSLEERYSKEFLDHCIIMTEEDFKAKKVQACMLYNKEENTFSLLTDIPTIEEQYKLIQENNIYKKVKLIEISEDEQEDIE